MRLVTTVRLGGATLLSISGLIASTMAAAAAPNSVFVSKANCSGSGPGTSGHPYCTIQQGVNAVPAGGTIYIQDGGTYNEQVTVKNKDSVTIQGFGSTIKMPASVTTGGTILSFKNAKGWKVNNLNVAGPFNVSSCASEETGVSFGNNTSASVNNMSVTNVAPADVNFFGCQQGVGVYVAGGANNPADVTLSHLTVSGYAKDGIEVDGNGTNAKITQSKVTGVPTALTALNGIQVSRGATATLTQNTVTGNEYNDVNHTGYTAAGFIVYEAGKVTANQNKVDNNDVGFDIEGSSGGSYSQNNLSGNTTNGFFVSDQYVTSPPTKNNTFTRNSAHGTSGTTEYTPYDVEDDTAGNKSAGTANTWNFDTCNTSTPAGLCVGS